MLALWDEDKVIIKDLVQRTRFDAGTLTPILKRLETKGLVSTAKATGDSRQKLVLLTATGKQTPDNISCQIKMTPQDAQQLKALAEQLYSLIQHNLVSERIE